MITYKFERNRLVVDKKEECKNAESCLQNDSTLKRNGLILAVINKSLEIY